MWWCCDVLNRCLFLLAGYRGSSAYIPRSRHGCCHCQSQAGSIHVSGAELFFPVTAASSVSLAVVVGNSSFPALLNS